MEKIGKQLFYFSSFVFEYSFLLKSGVAMAIFRISHHFQLVLMFTIFYNKKIFSLKSNICQQKKITRYQVINKENMLVGWEKEETQFRVFSL